MSRVVWHDIECGRYREDLSLWLGLAAELAGSGPVLDVGSGTGRVSVALARGGHPVVALDLDRDLLAALESRATGLPVQVVCADARSFTIPGAAFPLIIVPMQTIQLLGGADGHRAFLQRARAHLAQGGAIAVAIAATEDFEEFEYRDGDLAPLPDIAEIDGRAYFSQPTAVRRVGDAFRLERRREIVEPDGARSSEEDRITLDIVSAEGLARTAAEVGLGLRSRRRVAATAEHIGSEVVILGA
ncbi:MAG TPA: class I SAM-dependent methyltransferase [Solirubrobacteraceae bacterium]|nr:class I SAM-dependent methyltransferase [Solirubrobacteraceae bacterium]